jgi:cytochrome c556
MIRPILVALAILAGATAVLAQSDPVKTRQDLMKQNEDGATVLFRMTRGEVPFDAAKVQAAYKQLEDTAKQLPNLFPDNTKGGSGTNRASPKIWDNKADFAAKNEQFAKAIADGQAKATTLDGLKTAFGALDKACGDCHQSYRLPRRRS